ncbi:hypothetical protein BG015_003676, partial [Linnemannia schmuckeri]
DVQLAPTTGHRFTWRTYTYERPFVDSDPAELVVEPSDFISRSGGCSSWFEIEK